MSNIERQLQPNATLGFCNRHATVLIVQAGRVWLTNTHDTVDYFVSAGEEITLAPGRIVLSGEGPLLARFVYQTHETVKQGRTHLAFVRQILTRLTAIKSTVRPALR